MRTRCVLYPRNRDLSFASLFANVPVLNISFPQNQSPIWGSEEREKTSVTLSFHWGRKHQQWHTAICEFARRNRGKQAIRLGLTRSARRLWCYPSERMGVFSNLQRVPSQQVEQQHLTCSLETQTNAWLCVSPVASFSDPKFVFQPAIVF